MNVGNTNAKKISEQVLQVLDAAIKDGPRLVLVGQLERKMYEAANDVLVAAGGKWNKSAKAHIFDGDAAEAMEPIILTGEFHRTKQDFGQFDTPSELAANVVALARIEPGMHVLEPSVGVGNIAREIRAVGGIVHAFEIDAKRRAVYESAGLSAFPCASGDFLSFEAPERVDAAFDRVVMNPPFGMQADIDHVLHAAKFVKPGGRVVAIMSLSVMFRENRKTGDFRQFVVACGGMLDRLPEGSFKASGTSVNACIVALDIAQEPTR